MENGLSVQEGMRVCDSKGERIGTVRKIYRPAPVLVRGLDGAEHSARGEPYLRVDTGPLGLGKRYYVPLSGIKEVTADCVLLSIDRRQLERMGWDHRPYFISE